MQFKIRGKNKDYVPLSLDLRKITLCNTFRPKPYWSFRIILFNKELIIN